jgi:hypothetical protein
VIPYPAVTVHGLEQAILALAPGRPVALLSAVDAALFGGCGWWRALISAAQNGYPQTPALDILDCGDAAGRAVEALRSGCRTLILDPTCPAFAAVASIAATTGATLLRERPPSLDMALRNAPSRLSAWLDVRYETP